MLRFAFWIRKKGIDGLNHDKTTGSSHCEAQAAALIQALRYYIRETIRTRRVKRLILGESIQARNVYSFCKPGYVRNLVERLTMRR